MIALLLTTSIALSVAIQVQASSIDENWTTWVNYAFKGTDSFYSKDVVAYKVGSTATLAVAVINDFAPPSWINVTVVGVSFDWQKPAAGWYNSTQASSSSPVRLEIGETRYFIVNFTVPDLTTAYMVVHDYKVYAEGVNKDGTSFQWTKTRAELFGAGHQYFVVYSADQAQARKSAQTIEVLVTSLGGPSVTWSSAKAGLLWKKAMNQTSIAAFYYGQGDFTNAEKYYSAALVLIDLTFEAEETRGVRLEDANIKLAEGQAKFYDAQANFYNGFSNMWTLFGVALVLFAIGYIIRGFAILRKPAVPT